MNILKGYRTILFNALAAVVPIIDALMPLLTSAEFEAIIPDDWMKSYALFVVVANMYLRKITDSALGQK